MTKLFFACAAAALLCGCATETAESLGERYWRTKSEEDRVAWIAALDREGHDFSKRYKADYGERGIYKFNRETKLACFVITKSIAERLGKDVFDETTPDGPVHFEWTRKDDGTVDYRYSAPTNWEVFVRAFGDRSRRNPIEEANKTSLCTSFPKEGVVSSSVFHHREDWLAGPHAEHPFPTNEIAATLNFTFALRDAFRRLGFDKTGAMDGSVWLATFQSHYPNGHTDFPAHFHIGVSSRDSGQVHHFYVRPQDGRITSDCFQDMSNVIDVWDRAVEFKPGEEFPYFDNRGHVAFRAKILGDGTGIELMTADRVCRVRVASPAPKDFVDVLVPTGESWRTVRHVAVEDDVRTGVMKTPDGEIRYDPATGKLLEEGK